MQHITTIDTLREAYYSLKRDTTASIDGQTWRGHEDRAEVWRLPAKPVLPSPLEDISNHRVAWEHQAQ